MGDVDRAMAGLRFTEKESETLVTALRRGHEDEGVAEDEMERKVEQFMAWALSARINQIFLELVIHGRMDVRLEEGEKEPDFLARTEDPSDESIEALIREWQQRRDDA